MGISNVMIFYNWYWWCVVKVFFLYLLNVFMILFCIYSVWRYLFEDVFNEDLKLIDKINDEEN